MPLEGHVARIGEAAEREAIEVAGGGGGRRVAGGRHEGRIAAEDTRAPRVDECGESDVARHVDRRAAGVAELEGVRGRVVPAGGSGAGTPVGIELEEAPRAAQLGDDGHPLPDRIAHRHLPETFVQKRRARRRVVLQRDRLDGGRVRAARDRRRDERESQRGGGDLFPHGGTARTATPA